MFQPSRDAVRHFFCQAWARHRAGVTPEPLELIALGWILQHPEYHGLLDDPAAAVQREFPPADGRENPFLHLAMHLLLEEQSAIDQPLGIRALLEALAQRYGDRHAAAHEAMECLGEMLWQAQRGTLAPDTAQINLDYVECLKRRLGRGDAGP